MRIIYNRRCTFWKNGRSRPVQKKMEKHILPDVAETIMKKMEEKAD